ncbi:reverse transcriptase domain-containing protein [Vibrio jasicida]|uniref:reverse transcriptase domain-containing protein n=1 Tax=Vibrio jasicida TaxID=766224 RepID=UPI001E2B2164|nr:reverse transcriptase domain-containing protein [Vibrio jasicida]
MYYSVEDGGTFHTPTKGIARSSSLSPLLAAFHLYCVDEYFANHPHYDYVRYMDDFVILTKTRWQLRKAVATLNQFFNQFGFVQHPDKTFIGKIDKGFDWMGVWFNKQGAITIAPRALQNHLITLARLYEQTRNLPANEQVGRVSQYIKRWQQWASKLLDRTVTKDDYGKSPSSIPRLFCSLPSVVNC